MPREKEGYRDILMFLMERYPATMSRKQAAEAMGMSTRQLYRVIQKKHIKVQDGKIPVGSVASYLCG